MSELKPILFTVFEPSGDVLAARLIEEIKRREPGRRVVALGGPKMEEAGAKLLEESTGHAKMGLGAASEAKELLRRKGLIREWVKENDIAALVPTDSPAANWSMCKVVRKERPGARIVHLVCPQIWAWASWRIIRLRKLSDHVMCLLPFEPGWLGERGVKGTLVGHPLYQEPKAEERDAPVAVDGEPLKDGEPKLALLPGSRAGEIDRNWPEMLEAYGHIRHRYPHIAVTIAAVDKARQKQIELLCPGGRPPRGMQMVVGDAGGVLDWADAAVVVSGTATLQAASRGTPTVVVFNISKLVAYTIGKTLVRAKTFALPNLIAEALEMPRVMPELVPHHGDVELLVKTLTPLLSEGAERQAQREGFEQIRAKFESLVFREAAADVLLGEINGA